MPAALAAGFKRSYAPFAAHRMLRRPIVARVIEERQKTRLRVLVPKAVDVVEEILDNKEHKDRLKAANQVLNRVDPVFVGVAHQHDVNVTVNTREMEELVRRLAVEMGVTPEKLLGANPMPLIEGKVVLEAESEPDDGDGGDVDWDNDPDEE